MASPHKALRSLMCGEDINQEYLASLVGRSTTYISDRITGKRPWDFDTMCRIIDELKIPRDQIFLYFPPYEAMPKRLRGEKR